MLSRISAIVAQFGAVLENTNLIPLQKIENRATRIVTNSPYDASAPPPPPTCYKVLAGFQSRTSTRKETAKLTYRSLNSSAPHQHLMELFTKYSEGYGRSLHCSERNLQIPLHRKSMYENLLCYR